MKTLNKIVSVLLLVAMLVLSLASCQTGGGNTTTTTQKPDPVDYAAQLKLDMNSSSAKTEIGRDSIKTFVDGDTTHFYVDNSVAEFGVLKARYMAINTPESTGKIEPYGRMASRFTKEKLSSAVSIVLESDDEKWNLDSTGDRHMVWVWYKTSADGEYRNLNLEILQNGLALPSNAGNNRYGSYCTDALAQARALSLYVFSGVKDPEMFEGDAIELTLKELRLNIEEYNNKVVTFEAGVVMNTGNNSVYVESYDEETGLYYGMSVYYGFGLEGPGMEILFVGNRVRIVGCVQYYEAGGTYQISDIKYDMFKPNDPQSIKKLGDGYEGAFTLYTADQFVNGKADIVLEDSVATYDVKYLTMNSSISFENLKVKRASTTTNPASASKGAITLYCECNGVEIVIRTNPLYDADRNLLTQDMFVGKTINVKGFVEYYLPEGQTTGQYQIKVLTPDQITILD